MEKLNNEKQDKSELEVLLHYFFQIPVTIWRSNVQEEVAELRGEVEELQTQLLRHQVAHN